MSGYFPDTSQGDTSFSLQEKEAALVYLVGIQICFGRKACFFPAVGQHLHLNSKEEEYSYVWPLLPGSVTYWLL